MQWTKFQMQKTSRKWWNWRYQSINITLIFRCFKRVKSGHINDFWVFIFKIQVLCVPYETAMQRQTEKVPKEWHGNHDQKCRIITHDLTSTHVILAFDDDVAHSFRYFLHHTFLVILQHQKLYYQSYTHSCDALPSENTHTPYKSIPSQDYIKNLYTSSYFLSSTH
jgi:hypothetical protein